MNGLMKKTTLLVALLLQAVCALALNVSEETARRAASAFSSSGTRGSGKVSLVWDGTDSSTRSSSQPPFYVFNIDGGGFVVISGDDAAAPVLGFSDEGSFSCEDMPSNVRGWFKGYADQMEYIRRNGIKAGEAVARLWESVTSRGESGEDYIVLKNLKTPRWDQRAPFNDKCPEVDGQQSVTGCVATAMGEIMKFHQWPKEASGTLPDYEYRTDMGNRRTQEGHTLSPVYNWSAMRDSYYGISPSQEEADAVSSLLFDLGVMLRSSYNGVEDESAGTGAFCEDVAPLLVKYMSYDSTAVCIDRDAMKYKEWADMLRSEIDGGRPLCYSGSSENGGHEFVIDGYGTNEYFHINWGWSGKDNGFFRLHALEPGEDFDFNYRQNATVGIRPYAGGHPIIKITYINQTGKGGFSVTGKIARGNTVTASAGDIYNDNIGIVPGTDMGSARLKYAPALVDGNGEIKEVYDSTRFTTLASGCYYTSPMTLECRITSEVVLGDKLVCCYREEGGKWTPIKADPYYLNRKSEAIVDEVSAFDFPVIDIGKDGYKAGDVLDLRISGVNSYPFTVWYFDGRQLDNEVHSVILTGGRHTVRAEVELRNGSASGRVIRKETLVRVIKVN